MIRAQLDELSGALPEEEAAVVSDYHPSSEARAAAAALERLASKSSTGRRDARASLRELEAVEGVGAVRAREIKEGLRRLQEHNLVEVPHDVRAGGHPGGFRFTLVLRLFRVLEGRAIPQEIVADLS